MRFDPVTGIKKKPIKKKTPTKKNHNGFPTYVERQEKSASHLQHIFDT